MLQMVIITVKLNYLYAHLQPHKTVGVGKGNIDRP